MPWALFLIVGGLVLRLGIDGYNLLGDILIALGATLWLATWLLVTFVFSKVIKQQKNIKTNFGRRL